MADSIGRQVVGTVEVAGRQVVVRQPEHDATLGIYSQRFAAERCEPPYSAVELCEIVASPAGIVADLVARCTNMPREHVEALTLAQRLTLCGAVVDALPCDDARIAADKAFLVACCEPVIAMQLAAGEHVSPWRSLDRSTPQWYLAHPAAVAALEPFRDRLSDVVREALPIDQSMFDFTPVERAIFDALDGHRLTVRDLAARLTNGDTGKFYRRGELKRLEAAGLILKAPGHRGYYRPDAPPPSFRL